MMFGLIMKSLKKWTTYHGDCRDYMYTVFFLCSYIANKE
jgi:hypothetical protein